MNIDLIISVGGCLQYQVLYPLNGFFFLLSHLLLCALSCSVSFGGVLWLQLQQSPQKVVWGDGETLKFSIWVKTIQGGVLRWKMPINITVVAIVVCELRGQEPRTQTELPFKLWNKAKMAAKWKFNLNCNHKPVTLSLVLNLNWQRTNQSSRGIKQWILLKASTKHLFRKTEPHNHIMMLVRFRANVVQCGEYGKPLR